MKNIVLDFSKCEYTYDFHMEFRRAMIDNKVAGFPDFCGKNLYAVWDVLSGFIETPIKFTIIPYQGKRPEAIDYCKIFVETINDSKDYDVSYTIKQ